MFVDQNTTEAVSAEAASAADGDETRGARGPGAPRTVAAGQAPSPAGETPTTPAAAAKASLLQKLLSQWFSNSFSLLNLAFIMFDRTIPYDT